MGIFIDDGIATGSTMIAALNAIRAKKPKKLIATMAVAPESSYEKIKSIADEVVCLATPEPFYAIGMFFDDFSQVADEEVMEILRRKREE